MIPPNQISAVLDLMRAAMECTTAHVFVEWSPHVQWVCVGVRPLSADYSSASLIPDYVLDERIRLGDSAVEFEIDTIPALRELTERIKGL